MGKRKKSNRKPQGPKKREALPTTFACLFCNHENSVRVKLDKKAGTGELSCKVCGQQFQTGINYLSAGVDVYSEWIDACEFVKDPTDPHPDNDGIHPTYDPAGSEDQGPGAQLDRHLDVAAEGDEDADGDYY